MIEPHTDGSGARPWRPSHGVSADAAATRTTPASPPGQTLVRDWPVLSAGATPEIAPADWSFSIRTEAGLTEWTWDEVQALGVQDVTVDIHCVTHWTKLDMPWRGVPLDTLFAQVETVAATTCMVAQLTAATRRTSRSTTCSTARPGSPSRRTASPSIPSTAGRRGCSCRTCTSGRARSGCAGSSCRPTTNPGFWERHGLPPARRSLEGGAVLVSGPAVTRHIGGSPPPSSRTAAGWHTATVASVAQETPNARRIVLDVPTWPGNDAGQHLDLRLTAQDGYQATRSYSIASAGDGTRVILAVDRVARRRGLTVPGRRGRGRRRARGARAARWLLRLAPPTASTRRRCSSSRVGRASSRCSRW